MRYINELREGETIIEHYLCKTRQSMKSKNGKNYLSLKLQDKTGIVDAKVWDLNNEIQSFQENDFIKIEAYVTTYNNELQLNVKRVRRSREGEYAPEDYIPSTSKNIAQMQETFLGYIKTITNPYLKQLLEEVFLKHPVISKEFRNHSAAKTMHHGYLGGLLEHTLSVTQICDFLAKQYPSANRDLLVTSAMLHDVCKVMELSNFPNNDYTDEGQLLGHIVLCVELIGQITQNIPNFPSRVRTLLQHNILSHHGEFEFGSPKLPATIEAMLLHCADNLDAKTKMIEEAIEADSTQGHWVGFNRMLQRNLCRSDYE